MKHLKIKKSTIVFVSIFFLACFLLSNNRKNADGFIINGKIKGDYKGYILLYYNELKDSCLVSENKFTFTGKVPFTSNAMIGTEDEPCEKDFYIENTIIDINLTVENKIVDGIKKYYPRLENIKGTKTIILQEDFKNFKNENEFLENWNSKLYDKLINLSKLHSKNSYIGILLDEVTNKPVLTKGQINNIYKNLNFDFQNKYALENLKNKISIKSNEFELNKILDFKLPNPNNIIIKTKDYRGSYLLIDFWASWCAPCRKEFPQLKKIYAKYHDKEFKIENKGFKVIGISLDDDKLKWIQAIKKDSLIWDNVNEKGGFLSEIAKKYNVMSIPNNVLFDGRGNVVRKNITPNELEKFLSGNLK